MSGTAPHRLAYAPPNRRWRIKLSVPALLICLTAGVLGVRRPVVTRVRLLYWQHRCATWDGPVARATAADPVPWPAPFRSLWAALIDSGCPIRPSSFNGRRNPVVFLHSRTSSGGTRRLICLALVLNEDHAERFGLDCLSVGPATLTRKATVTVCSTGTFYSDLDRWGSMSEPVTADAADPSHFTFRIADEGGTWTASPAGEGQIGPPYTVVTHMIDGYLRDDGHVDLIERPTASAAPIGQ